jgi:hypothetical protein
LRLFGGGKDFGRRRLTVANIIPVRRIGRSSGDLASAMDILNDFIGELYEDGTVDRWKRERAREGEATEGNMILRKKHARSFTTIGNAALQDSGLSWEARGLLTYLYTLPDDWKIHERELWNHATNRRHSTHKALQELIDRGYVNKRQGKNIWNDTEFDVDDEPHTPEEWAVLACDFSTDCTEPLAENQHSLSRKSAQPLAENQHIQNTQYKIPKKIKNTKGENKNQGTPEPPPEENPPLSLSPFPNPNLSETADLPEKNYAVIFEKIKERWKEVIGQDTRGNLFTVPPMKREKFINTLANYTLDEIFNAIGNYRTVRNSPEKFDIGGRTYGNLYGFLENGVSQFFQDEVTLENFRRKKGDR